MWQKHRIFVEKYNVMEKPILNLLTFASVISNHDEAFIRAAHAEIFTELDKLFSVNIILGDKIKKFLDAPAEGVTVVFNATGGTEGMIVKNYARLPKPLTLVTDGKANSLAASLEVSCWVRQQGDECRLLHGQPADVAQRVLNLKDPETPAPTPISGCRIGVIGEPSDWLVSSNVNYAKAKKIWGVDIVDIGLNEIESHFVDSFTHYLYHKQNAKEIEAVIERFTKGATCCVEPNLLDLRKAALLYLTLKHIVNKYSLDAITVQCFTLISSIKTTGCLALSLLNDDGIMAGCEGDIPSTFTMLLAKRVTGIDGFMANPAFIDTEDGSAIFAHCTIGLKQTTDYTIRSHFESNSGVAVQGKLPCGDVTLVKVGGEELSQSIVLTGKIVENQNDPHKCRTQILIKFDNPKVANTYFFKENIGNHHIILIGNHAEALTKILNTKNQN